MQATIVITNAHTHIGSPSVPVLSNRPGAAAVVAVNVGGGRWARAAGGGGGEGGRQTRQEASLPEGFFVSYGHCLLAGAGIRTESRARATTTAPLPEHEGAAPDSGNDVGTRGEGAPTTTATTKTAALLPENEHLTQGSGGGGRGGRGHGDGGGGSRGGFTPRGCRGRGYSHAIEVFDEGLRRFPTSAGLLYGASLAMQVQSPESSRSMVVVVVRVLSSLWCLH